MKTMTIEVPIEANESGCLIVPKGAKVGVLDLSGRQDITALPANLHASAIDLSGSNIAELPSGMKIDSWLDIQDTSISVLSLPSDLEIGTDLFFRADGELQSLAGSSLRKLME